MNTLATTKSNTSNCKRSIAISNPTISTPASFTYFSSRQSTIACSSTGQYVSYCVSGCIYTSSNYGHLFSPILIPYSFSSICMSSSGQYQYVSASPLPEGGVWSSTDFGVTFIRRLNIGANTSRYIEKIICNSTGQNSLALGAGNAGQQNFYSNNYGSIFTSCNDALIRVAGCFNGNKVLLYEYYTNTVRTLDFNVIPPVETTTTQTPYGTSLGQIINENDNILLLPLNHTSVQTSNNFGLSWVNNVQGTPTFKHAFVINSIFYACSTNIVYKSINQGITWTIVYTLTGGNTIKSFTGIATKIFMVYNSGSIAILTL